MNRGVWRILVAIALLCSPALAADNGYRFDLPNWAPEPAVPADNPMSAAKIELGRHLFYDKRLSVNGTMSCGSCHQQSRAFTDGEPVHIGVHGDPGLRNVMPLANVAYLSTLTWSNPNVRRLEDQALIPIFGDNPPELGMQGREPRLFADLQSDGTYRPLFRAAFPERDGAVDLSTITKALASFLRSLLSFNSPYDRYRHGGDVNALSPAAKRGEALFFGDSMKCSRCHSGLNFTDNFRGRGQFWAEVNFHNTGLYNLDGKGSYPSPNHGLREFTENAGDEGKFRTPSLRNVALTAPYMHDGSIATLEDVIRDHYALGGRAASSPSGRSPLRDPLIKGFSPSDVDVADLVAFLNSLTDETFVTNPKFSDPFGAGSVKGNEHPAANSLSSASEN